MKKNTRRFRFLFGLVVASVFGLATYVGVLAGPAAQPDYQVEEVCQGCHPALYVSWQNSAHGQALDDPSFQENWESQGKPRECLICHTTGYDPQANTWVSDGITCLACHGPMLENHPEDPMPSDRSAALCEGCHSQTVFEWNISIHRQSGLDCVDCHGQHSTTLRAEDTVGLCASCHRERSSDFTHSTHSKENLTCPDCHLETLNEDRIGDRGSFAKDHDFRPKLSACNECHEYQMHDQVEVPSQSGLEVVEIAGDSSGLESQNLSITPGSVNPVSFALLSALIGMAGGLLVAPWIQEWYHKFDFKKQSDQDPDGENKDG